MKKTKCDVSKAYSLQCRTLTHSVSPGEDLSLCCCFKRAEKTRTHVEDTIEAILDGNVDFSVGYTGAFASI